MKKLSYLIILAILTFASFSAMASRPFPESTNFYLYNCTHHQYYYAHILYKNGHVGGAPVKCFSNLHKYVCVATIPSSRFAKAPVMKMAITAGKRHGCGSKFYTYEQLQLSSLTVRAMPGTIDHCYISKN